MQKLYYLASPYTHQDPAVMEKRFEIACKVTAELMNRKLIVWSPIASTHPIAVRHELPRGFEYWEEYDKTVISRCDALIVLCTDGYDYSIGVNAEIKFAKEIGIPIYKITEDDLELRNYERN